MTEISVNTNGENSDMPPAVERFVLRWGEMGTRWGVNRSVGQIHALLYLSEYPMTAKDIATTLGMARSNVSTSLKELMNWELIRRVHVMRDRRDFFEAEKDLWEMLRKISEGRKGREIDPALDVLRTCVAEAESDEKVSKAAQTRLSEMLEFMQALDLWYAQMVKLPTWKLKALVKMGSAIARFVGLKKNKESAYTKAGDDQ